MGVVRGRGDVPKWIPSKKSSSYSENFDQIKWASGAVPVKKGKAKMSTAARMLNLVETVQAVRVPILERNHRTFQNLD